MSFTNPVEIPKSKFSLVDDIKVLLESLLSILVAKESNVIKETLIFKRSEVGEEIVSITSNSI